MASWGILLFCVLLELLVPFSNNGGCDAAACTAAPSSTTQTSVSDEDNLKKLAVANNYFGQNMYLQLEGETTNNVFISPLSLSTAFSMLYYGARGDTAEELRNVLGYDKAGLSDGEVPSTFHLLIERLSNKDSQDYVLSLANAILLDQNLQLNANYKNEVQQLYDASVQDVDFASNGPAVVVQINDFVKNKTNGKIDQLLDELDPATVLVILNAVYFKGSWKTRFDPDNTVDQTFYNDGQDSGAKNVPMMHLTNEFSYGTINNSQILELPYKGENISMLVILPGDRDGLSEVEKSMTLDKISEIRQKLRSTKVKVSLPKFKVEFSKELSRDMQSLGANTIFSPGADFTGISPSRNIAVSQVIHKAVVEVNEEGSEAAAVTGIAVARIRPSVPIPTPEFVADHPFIFAIVDNRNDMILFVGSVKKL